MARKKLKAEERAAWTASLASVLQGERLAVIARPGAATVAVEASSDAEGRPALRIAVVEPPEDGRANAAIVALIADLAGCAKSEIELLSGATSRHKILRLPESCAAQLAER